MRNYVNVLSLFTLPPPATAIIAENGWQCTISAPTDLSLAQLPVWRQGFTTTGAATWYLEQVRVTKRVRQPYPNQASFTTDQVALSDWIYSTDRIYGALNGSLETSPKPIAAWVMPHSLLVADSVRWEIVAYHRNASNKGAGGIGQQVACVRVRANNGTTATAWQTVSETTISTGLVEDATPVEVFGGTLDISSLADGRFWLEAEVYPWIGDAASVLRSEDNFTAGVDQREFTRRWYRKGSTVNYIYVASTGSDTTGVVSTDPATAAASPALTVGGAIMLARTALGSGTRGALDGLRIRVVDTVSMGNPNSAFRPFRQDVAGVVIERAPATARSSAIVNVGVAFRPYFEDHSSPITEGSLIFYDVSVNHTAAITYTGETSNRLQVQFWNCNLNYGGFSSTLRNNSGYELYGVTATNTASNSMAFATAGQIRMMRGVTVDLNGAGWEGFINIGCAITRPGVSGFWDASRPWICANNRFFNPTQTTFLHWRGSVSGGTLGAAAVVQNLVERTATTNGVNLRWSGDSDFGSTVHSVIHHNTFTGISLYGRVNVDYDEHPTVARTHKGLSWKANLIPQVNVKGDDYSTILNGSRIGQFPTEHGVGWEGSFSISVDAGAPGESFKQAYGGLNCIVAGGDPLWTNYQGVTLSGSTPVAGAGGGTYSLQAGSPARSLLPYPVLKYDITGTARGTGPQHAGAYQS